MPLHISFLVYPNNNPNPTVIGIRTQHDKDGEGDGRENRGHIDCLRLDNVEKPVDDAEGHLEKSQNNPKNNVSRFERLAVVKFLPDDTGCPVGSVLLTPFWLAHFYNL
jgi:hypothetical protein